MNDPIEWAGRPVAPAPWRGALQYFDTRPGQAAAIGAVLVGLGVWLLVRGRNDLDDLYSDPLGTDFPPNLPADFQAARTEEEAA